MNKAEPFKPYNMWNAQKMSHDLEISPFAPSFCRKCKMSGAEVSERWCPFADAARLASTLDSLSNQP